MIELLVVLGILLILAGLAIENYQIASLRARVARVKAEHRTIRAAIEAYNVDYNSPPRMAHRKYGDARLDFIAGVPVSGVMSAVLSTPLAYTTHAFLLDPFMEKQADAPLDERLYTYQVVPGYVEWNPESIFWPAALSYYGEWRLGSVGPDQVFDHLFANSAQLVYDPTNGVFSIGNIWSAPRNAATCPEVPLLLGPH